MRLRYQSIVLSACFLVGLPAVAQETASQEILKFAVLPEKQKVYPGFTPLAAGSMYGPEAKFGWTTPPEYLALCSRYVGVPDLLTCNVAAPSKPLYTTATGYKGHFEFRVDVPAGEYGVQVISGNYAYQPSQSDSKAMNYRITTGDYPLPAPEQITANGQLVFERSLSNDEMTGEFYHDMNTVLRRGMTPWDRYVAWRFPGRTFKATVKDQGLVLRFDNMPVNGIIIWPAAKEAEARAFLEKFDAERRAKFPIKDITPEPEEDLPDLPADTEKKGYFLFVPHSLDKIFPNSVPQPEWMKDEITGFAALGQTDSFAFAVYPLKDLTDCEASVSDLIGPDGAKLPASAVDLRVLRYFEKQASNEAMAYTTQAYLPLKWGKIPIDQGVNRVYWLTMKPPEDAKPGVYKGTITFKPSNAPASTLGVNFRILPFKLRPLTDRFHALYHDYWLWPGGSEDRRVQCQRDIGYNVITTHASIPNIRYKDGQLGPLDFSGWEKALDIYRRNGFPMLLLISQGATSPAYSATNEPFTDPDYKGSAHQVKGTFSPEFDDCYKKLARAISDEFKKRDWPEIIFYDGGELAGEGPRGVATESHLMKMLHEAGVKNTTAISGPATPLSMKNSVPYMYMTIMHDFSPENIEQVKAAGSLLGAYGPGETRFERGFWFWRSGAVVCSEEGGVAFYGNPYDPFDSSIRSDWGDVYPTPDGPVLSVKTYGKKAGIDDSRYLFHLEKLIAEANQSGSDEAKQAAAAARKSLDGMARAIKVDVGYYWKGAEQPAGPVLDALRLKVAEHIIALEALAAK